MKINLNGLFAKFLKNDVERQKKKFDGSKPQLFINEKNQLWYMLMNKVDGHLCAEPVRSIQGAGQDMADRDETSSGQDMADRDETSSGQDMADRDETSS